MKLYGQMTNFSMNDSSTLTIGMNYCFYTGSAAVNDSTDVTISQPGTITSLLVNQAMATALASAVNLAHGTSFGTSDVLLLSGAVALPLL